MDEPLDASERAAVRLRGDLDVGLNVGAHFAALEISRDESDADGAYHMRLDGTLGEIRKLRAVNAAFDEMLAHLATGPDDAAGSITLRASPALAREIAAAERAHPGDVDRVAFAIERYEPESVSRRTAEWSL